MALYVCSNDTDGVAFTQIIAFNSHLDNLKLFLYDFLDSSDNWAGWGSWAPCLGECTFYEFNKTRTRVCPANYTVFGADACPSASVNTETRDCNLNWVDDPAGVCLKTGQSELRLF